MRYLLAGVAVTALIVAVLATFLAFEQARVIRQMREQDALQCTKDGEGSDYAIVQCYSERGLNTPDGL